MSEKELRFPATPRFGSNMVPVNQVVVGDCREVLAAWPEASVDMAMFSPPYFGLRAYDVISKAFPSREAAEVWQDKTFSYYSKAYSGTGFEKQPIEESPLGFRAAIRILGMSRIWGRFPPCDHEWTEVETPMPNASGGTSDKQLSNRGSHFAPYRHRATRSETCPRCGAWRGQLGLEPDWRMYVSHMVEICREIKRTLKKTGSMYLVLGDTYNSRMSYKQGVSSRFQIGALGTSTKAQYGLEHPIQKDYPTKCLMGIPWRVALALIDDSWILRNDIVWYKPNAMPSSVKDRLSNKWEHIFHFTKSQRYYYALDAIREPHSPTTHPYGKGGSFQVPRRSAKFPVAQTSKDASLKWGYASKFKDSHRNPLGKNPGDIFATRVVKPHPYKSRDPARHINPLGVNPGDVTKARQLRESTPFIHHESGHVGDHRDGKNPGDFWAINTKPFPGAHFATYPPKLCEGPIMSSCPPGGVVLDPMCGSGSTGVMALKLGRRFIGIDLNPEYAEMARRRLSRLLLLYT